MPGNPLSTQRAFQRLLETSQGTPGGASPASRSDLERFGDLAAGHVPTAADRRPAPEPPIPPGSVVNPDGTISIGLITDPTWYENNIQTLQADPSRQPSPSDYRTLQADPNRPAPSPSDYHLAIISPPTPRPQGSAGPAHSGAWDTFLRQSMEEEQRLLAEAQAEQMRGALADAGGTVFPAGIPPGPPARFPRGAPPQEPSAPEVPPTEPARVAPGAPQGATAVLDREGATAAALERPVTEEGFLPEQHRLMDDPESDFSAGYDRDQMFRIRSGGQVIEVPPEAIDRYGSFEGLMAQMTADGRLTPNQASEAASIFNSRTRPQAPRGRGPRPLDSIAGTSIRLEQSGPVSAEAMADLAEQNAAVEAAQLRQRQAEQAANTIRAEALASEADLVEQQAQRRQQEAEQIASEVRDRLGAVDRLIEAAGDERVDPEAFFGGPGGRIAATIATAVGAFAQALTGGPNTALEIIDRGVQNSIQTQMANQQQSAREAGQAMNAFQMFRQAIGDEQIAADLTRLAEMRAHIARLNSMIQTSTGERQDAARQLLAALEQRAAAAGEVTRQQANGRIVTEVVERRRIPQGTVARMSEMRQRRQAVDDAAFNAVRGARQIATLPPEQRPAVLRQILSDVDTSQAGGRFDEAEGALAGLLADPNLPAEERATLESRLQAVRVDRANRLGLDAGGGVHDTSERGRRLGRSEANGSATPGARREAQRRRQRTRETYERNRQSAREMYGDRLPENIEEANDRVEQLQAAITLRVGDQPEFPGLTVENAARARREWANASPEQRREFQERATDFNLMTRMMSTIELFRRNNRTSVLSTHDRAVARDLATRIRQRTRLMETGAAAAIEELDGYLERMPDPSEVTAASVIPSYDRVYDTWTALWANEEMVAGNYFQVWGYTPNSMAGTQRIRDRAEAGARRRAARSPRPGRERRYIRVGDR